MAEASARRLARGAAAPPLPPAAELLEAAERLEAPRPAVEASAIFSLLMTGEAPEPRQLQVRVDYPEEFHRLMERVWSGEGFSVHRMAKRVLSYRYKFPEMGVDEVSSRLGSAKEPLRALARLVVSEFHPVPPNPKYVEALTDYATGGNKLGVFSYYYEDTGRLAVLGLFKGKQTGAYAAVLVVGPGDEGLEAKVACTCPHFAGKTVTRRGREMGPVATDFCKHTIALLYSAAPRLLAYLSLYREKKAAPSLMELSRREEEVSRLVYSALSPGGSDRDTVLSNLAYLVMQAVKENTKAFKLVPANPAGLLSEASEAVPRTVAVERGGEGEERRGGETVQTQRLPPAAVDVVRRLESLGSILDMLQGSRRRTLYTRALLVSLLLSADPSKPPVLVSVVGSPGTGKTLAARKLAELVGVPVYRFKVRVALSLPEAAGESARRVARTVCRIVDCSDGEEEELARVIGGTLQALLEAPASPEAVEAAAGIAAARVFPGWKREDRGLVAGLLSGLLKAELGLLHGNPARPAALKARRRLLEALHEAGAAPPPALVEERNGGPVRWGVQEEPHGYTVYVDADAAHLVSRLGLDGLRRLLDHMRAMGVEVETRVEPARLAVISLTNIDYVEKLFWTRGEDPLSPEKKLIWIAGPATNANILLIDEASRSPETLERLLTELGQEAGYSRRGNLVLATDNVSPLMEAEMSPELDPLLSRKTMLAVTPDVTVAGVVEEGLERIEELRRAGRLPLVTLDELYALSRLADRVAVPPVFVEAAYSLPLLLAYELWVPEKLVAGVPLVKLVEAGGEVQEPEGFRAHRIGAVRAVVDNRLPFQVLRVARGLALLSGRMAVEARDFVDAVLLVSLARIVPTSSGHETYLADKWEAAARLASAVEGYVSRSWGGVESLVAHLARGQTPPLQVVEAARSEAWENPVAAAALVRGVVQAYHAAPGAVEQAASHEPLRLLLEEGRRLARLYW